MRNFTSPVGRMVQGDLFTPQTTDQSGAPRVVKSGPRAGQPSPQWFIALAFAKTDPAWPAFFAELQAESAAAWPSLFPQGPAGPCALPSFSNKIMDGDGVDQSGKPNAAKEGFAGHWIVKFASGFAPKVFPQGHYAPHEMITDALMARRGWYYRVVGSIDTNSQPQKPGIYVNMAGVELCGHGPEIVGGPDFAQAFGAAPVVLPPGASATPVAGAPLHPQGVGDAPPAVPAGPYTPPIATPASPSSPTPISPSSPPPAPAAPAAPYTPPMQPPPPPPPGPRMTAKAAGVTYEAFVAQGWTDVQLIQQGYMEDQIPH